MHESLNLFKNEGGKNGGREIKSGGIDRIRC
jgi:hypothetical protein